MKKPTKIKNGFYKSYLQDQQPKVTSKPQEQIIIVNQEEESFTKVLFNTIGAVIRATCYILLFLLSSVGLTALINDQIREMILELVL